MYSSAYNIIIIKFIISYIFNYELNKKIITSISINLATIIMILNENKFILKN